MTGSEGESESRNAGAAGAGSPPGRPGPEDEFADIPRRRRSPILSIAAVLFALYLAFTLRQEVVYALSSATPMDLGDARRLADRSLDALPLNRYVRVAGLPDRESAVILDTQGSWTFGQFFRLLGTGGRLFVRRMDDPLPVDRAERDVFVGRLTRLSELSYAPGMQRHFANHVTASHIFKPADLVAALASGSSTPVLTATSGDRVTLAPQDELVFDLARPGDLELTFPRDRFPDLEAIAGRVAQAGGEVVEKRPAPTPEGAHVIVARFSEAARDVSLSALGDLDRRLRIGRARDVRRARVAELRASASGLSIAAGAGRPVIDLPLARLTAVRTLAPVEIPEGALVLIEGDRPRDHFRSLVILVFLIGFAAVNLVALRRRA